MRIPSERGVSPSTARGWLGRSPAVVVGLPGGDVAEPDLRQELLKLQRRMDKFAALLRLALALRQSCSCTLKGRRLPDGRAKLRVLRAVDAAHRHIRLRGILRFLHLSAGRLHAWRRRQGVCELTDQARCPRTTPQRLTQREVQVIKEMVISPDCRHVPIATLAVLAQRLDTVCASPTTWYSLVRTHGWRRPRLRVHPARPTVGLRTTRPDETWHIDTTVIRLLDGTRAYLHAAIDNFSPDLGLALG